MLAVPHQTAVLDQSPPTLAAWGTRPLQMSLAVGIVALLTGAIVGVANGDLQKHLAYSYLVNLCFFYSISLGGLFFIAIQYVTRAGWCVVVRRLMEIIALAIAPMSLLFLPILLLVVSGSSIPFEWNDAELSAREPLIAGKTPYLNWWFFSLRAILYFSIWTWLALSYYRTSTEQDRTGEVAITNRQEGFSARAIMLFALSVTFASFDWLMSLDPRWFSTIFGVYYFAGGMVAFFATLNVVLYVLQQRNLLKGIVTVEHRHDLGKLMFGFNCFWAYIAFSQYLLIWYSNIPEETEWIQARQTGSWAIVSIIQIAGHFAIPFVGLLSRHAKRNFGVQTFWAVWLLVVQWIDLYWVAMPQLSPAGPSFGFIDLGMFVGVGGLFVASLLYLAGDRSLVPLHDPRVNESLQFQNI